jgi:RHS repeat-associated protein
MSEPASTSPNNFRFPGQYFDTETSLHYNYHRYYDSRTGRHLTPDPVGIEAGISLYHYVYSSPANFTDTFGLWTPTHHEEITRKAWARAHVAIPYGAIILNTIVKYNKLVDKDLIGENE